MNYFVIEISFVNVNYFYIVVVNYAMRLYAMDLHYLIEISGSHVISKSRKSRCQHCTPCASKNSIFGAIIKHVSV